MHQGHAMLVESLVFAASYFGTPAASRRFLVDAVGLWSRGHRQRKAWSVHTANTKRAIETARNAIQRRRTVVVLGSGPLFDVPLESLSKSFETVVLVDRAHLLPARRRARACSNVAVQWRDLSIASNPEPFGFLSAIADLDWVISVNILSQLAHGAPEGEERRVVDAHLDGLAALPCAATLITDFDYRLFDSVGAIEEHFDVLYGRPMPTAADNWIWEVAPFGEESPASRRAHSVAAYADWRQAAGQASLPLANADRC
jgi:hypothetical protein